MPCATTTYRGRPGIAARQASPWPDRRQAYGQGMLKRLARALGRFLAWVADVVKQVGGALNDGRSGDTYATKLYEHPRDDYRP